MSPAVLASIVLIVICAIGLVYCFRGNKSLRFFMMLYGLYAGYNLIMELYGAVYGWIWILALGLGIVIGLLALLFVKLSIFMAGGFLGVLVWRAAALANPAMQVVVAALIFFAIGGVITLLAKKPLIIVGTACYGAFTFTEALGILLGVWTAASVPAFPVMQITTSLSHISVFQSTPIAVPAIITILLAILGMVRQFRGSKGRRKKAGA